MYCLFYFMRFSEPLVQNDCGKEDVHHVLKLFFGTKRIYFFRSRTSNYSCVWYLLRRLKWLFCIVKKCYYKVFSVEYSCPEDPHSRRIEATMLYI